MTFMLVLAIVYMQNTIQYNTIQYKSNHKFLLSWQLANTFYSLEKLNWVCNDLPSRKTNPSLTGLTNLVYLNLSQSDFGGMSVPEIKGSFRNCIGEVFLMNLEPWPSNPLCHLISQGTIYHSIRPNSWQLVVPGIFACSEFILRRSPKKDTNGKSSLCL